MIFSDKSGIKCIVKNNVTISLIVSLQDLEMKALQGLYIGVKTENTFIIKMLLINFHILKYT